MEKVKRTRVLLQRPRVYEISACPCGNADPEWSEFEGHLWCGKCQVDFVPAHGGVFSGPFSPQAAMHLGLCLDRYNLVTGQVEKWGEVPTPSAGA